jgi:hypothetical protein
VLEIDPACAAVGCFPGDSPGYPIQITQPGSYKLTGNLDIRARPDPANLDAIQILAPAVTLDLAGFLLLGPTVCSGDPPTCAPTGLGVGVRVFDGAPGAVVRSGSISGFGFSGTSESGTFARLENLRAWSNGLFGVQAIGIGSQIVGVTAFANGIDGIVAGTGVMVRRSTTSGNGHHGVESFGANLIVDIVSYDNGQHGIFGSGRSVYTRNVSAGNGFEGLHDLNGGSIVLGNAFRDNTLLDLVLDGGTSGYAGNVLQDGAAVGGLSLGQNACAGGSC